MDARPSTDQYSPLLRQHLRYIRVLVEKGGPEPSEYNAFTRWVKQVARQYQSGTLSEKDVETIRAAFADALSAETLQGFSLAKPHGYTGDYEIIDRMYTKYVTDVAHLRNWDQFFQTQGAPTAVRNRKAYFLTLINALEATHPNEDPLPVLNIASGPARDVLEYFATKSPQGTVTFDCVDNDPDAIAYAKTLCAPYLDRITFHEGNALRFRTDKRYALIWSAGLFDYLGNKVFRFLLEHLLPLLREDGELVIGNFSPRNPSREYMEIVGDWHLHHRSEKELIRLALGCGISEEDIRIGAEAQGINLFLHIKRGACFLDLDAPA